MGLLQTDPRLARIAGLLGVLPGVQQTPGSGMPGADSPMAPAQMPQMQAPAALPDNRSLWDKIKDGAARLPQGLMPAPAGLSGLLSDDEQGAARHRGMLDLGLSLLANAHGQNGGNAPSLGQALQAGVGAMDQGYQGSLDKTLQGKITGMQLGQQQTILAGRKSIGAYLAQTVNGTPEQQMDAMRKAYMMATAIGDHETAKTLQGVIEKGVELQKSPKLEHVDMGDKIAILNPETGAVVMTYPKGTSPASAEAQAMRSLALQQRQDSIDMRREQNSSSREARHVGQYAQNAKPFAQSAAAYQTLNELRSAAMHGDPIAQQTALQDFIRMVLPGQMVAQGEIHNYGNLMGLGDKAGQILMRLEKGSPLSTAQIKSIYARADGLVKAKRDAANYLRKQAQDRAAKFGVDPEAFVDYFGYLDGETNGMKPAPVGAAAVDRHLNKDY